MLVANLFFILYFLHNLLNYSFLKGQIGLDLLYLKAECANSAMKQITFLCTTLPNVVRLYVVYIYLY